MRGPGNALFFTVMGGYLNWLMGSRKRTVFAGLPGRIVEIGPGVGANFRFMRPGTDVIAVEPNPTMRSRLNSRARREGINLDLRTIEGERIDVADVAVDAALHALDINIEINF